MRAIINDDLIEGTVDGIGATGLEIPVALRSVPLSRMRFNGKAFVDVSDVTTFWVDDAGAKHIKKGPGRAKVKCGVDDKLIRSGETWIVEDGNIIRARAIKAECRRRIVAVLKDGSTQTNLAGYVSELLARRVLDKGKLTPDEIADIKVARAARDWVGAMQAACRDLIADGAADFAADGRWPAVPDGAAELAARF